MQLITGQADKTSADAECKTYGGNVMTSKSEYSQHLAENFLNNKGHTDNIYLGISKASNGQWIWDDTKSTVFAERTP